MTSSQSETEKALQAMRERLDALNKMSPADRYQHLVELGVIRPTQSTRPTQPTPTVETIVAAAYRVDSVTVEGCAPYKLIVSVSTPGRHCHISWWLGAHGMTGEEQRDQGFLTSTGRFVDRKEGCAIARAAGQIDEEKKTGGANTLYSEDLW